MSGKLILELKLSFLKTWLAGIGENKNTVPDRVCLWWSLISLFMPSSSKVRFWQMCRHCHSCIIEGLTVLKTSLLFLLGKLLALTVFSHTLQIHWILAAEDSLWQLALKYRSIFHVSTEKNCQQEHKTEPKDGFIYLSLFQTWCYFHFSLANHNFNYMWAKVIVKNVSNKINLMPLNK